MAFDTVLAEMLSFQHLSSLCGALLVLAGPVQAGLDNTTSPTSIFRSVSSREYETLWNPSDFMVSDQIFTLPSSISTS